MDRITPQRQEIIETAADQATALTKPPHSLYYGPAIRQAANHFEISTAEISQELNSRKKRKRKHRNGSNE